MRVDPVSLLQLLLICHLTPAIQARAFPLGAMTILDNSTRASPLVVPSYNEIFKRRNSMVPIHGLPQGLQGVFQYALSFQPPVPVASFINFFWDAATTFHNDDAPGRFYQRFTYGSLALEITAFSRIRVNGKLEYIEAIVLREFVEATALWLHDAAQKGWTQFFQARVVDPAIGDTVYYIHLSNTWDSWMQSAKTLYLLETGVGLSEPSR